MNSSRNALTAAENGAAASFTEVPNTFRRRLLSNKQCLWPRRYVIALLLFILLLIQGWSEINITFTLAHVIVLGEGAHVKYPALRNWTFDELDNFKLTSVVAEIFAQIPGAILIFKFSGHKYILTSVIAASILNMLIPIALQHHSVSLLIVLVAQTVLFAPVNVAIMSIWKDWAAPSERTKLMIFSLFGIFLRAAATTFYPFLFHYVTTDESYYFAGISGLIWVLFWYNITSDTPQNDPLISEEELLYLEGNIPSDNQQKIKLKDVPWKSIITSKQVLILCIIFFKMACSLEALGIGGAFFMLHLGETYNPLYIFIPFLSAFVIILPCSAMLADCLIKKFRGRVLLIRKYFLCGGFILQCILMFGTISNSQMTKTLFYLLAYLTFGASLPGFITIPLDLSPRYISLVAGFIFIFYSIGVICVEYYVEYTISLMHLQTISWLFLFDGTLSIISAALFAKWGDIEEQLWSLTFPATPRSAGYRSYPKPDDEDDLNLVSERV